MSVHEKIIKTEIIQITAAINKAGNALEDYTIMPEERLNRAINALNNIIGLLDYDYE